MPHPSHTGVPRMAIRTVGSRRIPVQPEKTFSADDADPDAYRDGLSLSQLLVDLANRGEIDRIRAQVTSSTRNLVVILRTDDRWLHAATDLLRTILLASEEMPAIKRGGQQDLAYVLASLGSHHVILSCQPGDVIPDVYQRLAFAEVDVGRVRSEHLNTLISERWPGTDFRWPADRDVLSIPSVHLSTAFYQADRPEDVIEILDAIARHEADEAHVAADEPAVVGKTDFIPEKPKPAKKPVIDEKMKKAIQQVEVQSPTSPRVEDLAGYGAAAAWAQDLAQDVADYLDDEIAWSDVDRGCLLVGPPGTGKTMFAKALAATTGLPLIATSYAQWQSHEEGHLGHVVEMIRAVFARAEQVAPCILFIDEIDAIRGRGTDTRDDGWWTAITTCLLECLDGISRVEGIVTIGACNHADSLDPALVRSGRLDRRFEISLPDEAALIQILAHHAPDVSVQSLEPIATALAGTISGADVARMTREAKRSARREKREMTGGDLMSAALPPETRSREIIWRTAIHEAGHAVSFLVAGMVPDALSLIAGAGMSGHVRGVGVQDQQRLGDLEARVLPILCGRAAEDVILGEPSAAATQDLEQAAAILASVESAFGLGGYLTPVRDVDRSSVETRIRRLYGDALMLVVRHRRHIVELARLAVERRVLSRSTLETFGRERGLI
ncbi:AAA family ATPase [Jiella sp. M17.18]|uniref:AAA family ATPase n=1 Tax=Jiella sp. M17.18 TaxID=3234247 RepID=UPI0034E02E08